MSVHNYLAKYGRAVVKNGWPIVLLPHGQKAPVQKGWQNKTLSYHDVDGLISSGKRYGIGIQCGNIVGIDDDYEEEGVVTKTFRKAMNEIKNHYFPEALERLGRETRSPLRVIRLDDKAQAKSINIGKLQILGKGRQFVAYNIHPDTDQPYRWKKDHSPASVDIKEVPSFPMQLLNNFIKAVRILEETFGLDPGKAGEAIERIKEGDLTPGELAGEQSEITRAVDHLKNEDLDWDNWKRMLMALYNASKGEDWGRRLAHKFSSLSDKYDPDETNAAWQAMESSPPDRIGAGTVLWEARQNGMKPLASGDFQTMFVLERTGEIISSVNGEVLMNRTTFNDKYAHYKEKGYSPIALFMKEHEDKLFIDKLWDYELPHGVVDVDGKRFFNFYQEPDWFGEKGDIKPWLRVVKGLFGEDWEIVVKRMAFDVQYPRLRPQWHILAIGAQGVGKNDYILPLARWYDKYGMMKDVNIAQFRKDYNNYMSRARMLIVNEVDGIRNEIFNAQKDYLAGSNVMITVNPKYGREHMEKFNGSWYFTSNVMDPVGISIRERRLFIRNVERKRPAHDAVWTHTWLLKNWPHVIHYLKYEVEVGEDYGSKLPKVTQDHADMAAITARGYERIAPYVAAAVRGCAFFTFAKLHDHLLGANIPNVEGHALSAKVLTQSLKYLGAKRWCNGLQIYYGGQQLRLWTLEKHTAEVGKAEVKRILDLIGLDGFLEVGEGEGG